MNQTAIGNQNIQVGRDLTLNSVSPPKEPSAFRRSLAIFPGGMGCFIFLVAYCLLPIIIGSFVYAAKWVVKEVTHQMIIEQPKAFHNSNISRN